MAAILGDRSTESLQFVTLDVFTDQAFCGNPLAVVLGADGLSDARMLTIAREFNLSETIFVMAPRDPANTARVRIFFPTAEIPFAGHPTIGCAIHLATAAQGAGDFDTEIRLEEEAGLVPVRVWRVAGRTLAELTAPVLPHAVPNGLCPDVGLAASALGLAAEDIGFAGHRIGLWQGGPRFLYVPVATVKSLGLARPIEPHWSQVMRLCRVDSAYLYTPGPNLTCDFQARMFSPTAGIPEDPATGSASAILAAQLLAYGGLGEGETSIELMQGVEMGRPSKIGLRVMIKDDKIERVRVQGSAVPISQGQIRIP